MTVKKYDDIPLLRIHP